MKSSVAAVLMSLLVVAIGGCATSSDAPRYEDAPAPKAAPDQAVLYIYRRHAEPTAWSAYLEVDGKEAASLAQKGFTWVYVKPGKHNFKYAWPVLAGMPAVKFEMDFEAGKTYAFEMHGRVSLSGRTFTSTNKIQPTRADVAIANMAGCCRYVAPSGQNF